MTKLPNNTLEPAVNHRGRLVLAIDCALGKALERSSWAAQFGR
jgi:hypothetical protein